MNDTTQKSEDLVLSFDTFLKFNILVPERVSKKIKTDAVCTAFKETVFGGLARYTSFLLGVGWDQGIRGEEKVSNMVHAVTVTCPKHRSTG